ncbi:ATP-grasp domain-containing protein [Candidatus Woesebacteria bacterium]|nr:ATP-grasp domain-containing protein [Candidatus Woesebacteria bacterium]
MYIFIVGRPHKPIVDQLHHHGHVVGLFQSQTDSGEYDEMVDISIKLDLSSQEAIQSGLQSLDVPHIDSLISIYENFVRPKAWIAEALGVASISVPAAIAATDKVIMRQKFLEFDPRISPQFAEVESWDDAQQFVETYGLPVILKPAHLVKSLLVSKNESLEELRRNYDYMVENMSSVYHKYNVESRQPKIIIEEFLSGQQFSVEAFVRNENEIFLTDSVTEQVTAREFGVEDSFLYSRTLPSQLPENEQAAIRDVAIRGHSGTWPQPLGSTCGNHSHRKWTETY